MIVDKLQYFPRYTQKFKIKISHDSGNKLYKGWKKVSLINLIKK